MRIDKLFIQKRRVNCHVRDACLAGRQALLGVFTFCIILGLFTSPVYGEIELDVTEFEALHLTKGELAILKTNSLERVSITDPEVADIVSTEEDKVLIIAKSDGNTSLFVWDSQGKHSIWIYVFSQNLEEVKLRLEQLFNTAQILDLIIDVNEREGKVVISGDVPDYKQDMYEDIIEPFIDNIIDLVIKEKIEDLIEINVQVTELNHTLTRDLGIEWFTGTQTTSGSTVTTSFGDTLNPTFLELLPSFDGSVSDYFKIGDFQRATTSALVARVNALVKEGKARVLSNPNLVVMNGDEAHFLVGGQIPIRTTTTQTSGTTTGNVEYKEYGIGMTITPTIVKEKIDILMDIEISEPDPTNSTGSDVAFLTRTVQTHLFLDDGQTIVMAGLIKKATNEEIKKVPFLGDVPILGLLFRNKSTPVADQDQELVVSMTPHRIRQKKTSKSKEVKINTATEAAMIIERFEKEDARVDEEETARKARAKQDLQYYVDGVQRKIANSVIYPAEAEEFGWEGTVKVNLLILNDGTLAVATIKDSSGNEIFDEYALNVTKNVAPYSSFPSSAAFNDLNITIPIVYRLKKY